MVAGEPGSVPAAVHSALCLQLPSLAVCKTLGTHARIQTFRRLCARFLNELARPGAGRREERQWHPLHNCWFVPLASFWEQNHVSCSTLSACTTERHQTSDTLHPGWISHGLQFNKEEHHQLSSQDVFFPSKLYVVLNYPGWNSWLQFLNVIFLLPTKPNQAKEWWGDFSQLQIQIKQKSQFEFVPRDSSEFKSNHNLNSALYCEIPRDLISSILTSWLKSPHHSGFWLRCNSAFRVSSSTERAVSGNCHTCFVTVISVRAHGHCESARRSARR